MQGHVDEIVVVDTGSTDATRDIARRFGVVLLERQWRDDFAWARNEGLAAATGDWILYIDADERLSLPPDAMLADGLAGDDVFAARLWFRPRVDATPYREYRLFRNDPRLRFRGAMHETILPDLAALKSGAGAREVTSEARLDHLGYEEGSAWKHERNLPLLRAALAESPERTYYWHHLSETLAALGRSDEALATAREGLDRATIRMQSAARDPIAYLLALTLARLQYESGDDPLPAIEAGLAIKPQGWSLVLLKARTLVDRGDAAGAMPLLESICAIDARTYADAEISHPFEIFDVLAPDLMGIALMKLGRRAEAVSFFARAARAAPGDISYRIKAEALGARL